MDKIELRWSAFYLEAGMIHSVNIAGYRGLRHFEMEQLGCVNLLVGKNNSGKSSVLEAMYLLASGGEPSALWSVLTRRGERIEVDSVGGSVSAPEVDVSHLFCGHELRKSVFFEITTRNGRPDRSIRVELNEPSAQEELALPEDERLSDEDPLLQRLSLRISGRPAPPVPILRLTRNGGLPGDSVNSRRIRRNRADVSKPAQYISTESLTARELARMWNDIVLTENEGLVIKALQFVDPLIERIAAVTPSEYYYGSRGGFKIKLKDTIQPVPIGSLGDGTWRLLALTIALIRAKGGILLVDEIDTGLHYSVMTDLWHLIQNAARDNDVQVFATTHSYDCVKSLASICVPNHNSSHRVSIQRIEARKRKAVPFTENEIRMAAEKQIEIR